MKNHKKTHPIPPRTASQKIGTLTRLKMRRPGKIVQLTDIKSVDRHAGEQLRGMFSGRTSGLWKKAAGNVLETSVCEVPRQRDRCTRSVDYFIADAHLG